MTHGCQGCKQAEVWCGLGLYFIYCSSCFPRWLLGPVRGPINCVCTKAMLGPTEVRPLHHHWAGKCPEHLEFPQDSQVALKGSQVSRPLGLTMFKNRAQKGKIELAINEEDIKTIRKCRQAREHQLGMRWSHRALCSCFECE